MQESCHQPDSILACYDFMMDTLRRLALLPLLLLLAASASGQTTGSPPSGFGFDCWIGLEGGHLQVNYIRCIADRDLPHPELANQRLDAFLDDLHNELHQKSGADAERLYKSNLSLIRESASVWSIRIVSYPYEWSWQEGLPQQLVRAVLCPKDNPCTVKVYPR